VSIDEMKPSKMVATTVVGVMFFATPLTYASEYLGFDLGNESNAQVISQLHSGHASFNDNYGYQGYSTLPLIKVSRYARFDKLGSVNEAWLKFSPKSILYQINVVYSDSGATFKVLRDALDAKYGQAEQTGSGFESTYSYHDGSVDIDLGRNTFGFESDQKTTLTYTDTSLVNEVENAKKLIENDIRNKNAKKAGSDL